MGWGLGTTLPHLATTGPRRPGKVQGRAEDTAGMVTHMATNSDPHLSSLLLGDRPEKILKKSPLCPHFPNR